MDKRLEVILLNSTCSVMVVGTHDSGKVDMTKSILKENNIDFRAMDYYTLWRMSNREFFEEISTCDKLPVLELYPDELEKLEMPLKLLIEKRRVIIITDGDVSGVRCSCESISDRCFLYEVV